jgi:hypothetical protein
LISVTGFELLASRTLSSSKPPATGLSRGGSGPGKKNKNKKKPFQVLRKGVPANVKVRKKADSVACKMDAGHKCSQREKSLRNYTSCYRARQQRMQHGQAPGSLSDGQILENFIGFSSLSSVLILGPI